MTKNTCTNTDDLMKALYELSLLLGVTLNRHEKKAVQYAIFQLYGDYMVEHAGTGWLSKKGVIQKALAELP
jgi:hypothetical protein